MVRTTRQRTAVADALEDALEFHSAQELHRILVDRGDAVGLATVYRTLQTMADAGDVDQLRSPDGEVRYRKCERPGHHHLVCRVCGKTVEIDADSVESWAGAIAARYGFTDVEHTVELFGTCSDCAAKA